METRSRKVRRKASENRIQADSSGEGVNYTVIRMIHRGGGMRLAIAALAVLAVLGLNRDLFAFFARERGLAFATACVPLHLLYYLYSGLSYVAVWIAWQVGAIRCPDNRFPERGDVR